RRAVEPQGAVYADDQADDARGGEDREKRLNRHGLKEPRAEAEDGRRELDARVFDLGHELRPYAGGLDDPNDFAIFERFLFEQEHVLEGDLVAFHALHFGHVGHFARAIAHAALLDDDVHRRADLLANRAN